MSRLMTLSVNAVETNARTTDDLLGFSGPNPGIRRNAWTKLIDFTLVEWGRNPGMLDDEGVTPPSRLAILRAIEFAQAFAQSGFAAPSRVVPNGDGGIVFERHFCTGSETVEIESDGAVFYTRFHQSRIEAREDWTRI